MSSPAPGASLEEMRAVMARLPGPDLEAGTAAATREGQLTKPAGALGRLEELAHWMATWQGKHPPTANHPRTAVFVGNHGVAARGVSAYPAEVTQQMVQNFLNGGAAVNQLCRAVDADLRVYELALEEPTADFTYARLMRTKKTVKTGYTTRELEEWARRARVWAKRGDVFVYFISGAKERAPGAAEALIALV